MTDGEWILDRVLGHKMEGKKYVFHLGVSLLSSRTLLPNSRAVCEVGRV